MLLKISDNKDLIILNSVELITLKILSKVNRLNIFTIKEIEVIFTDSNLSSLFY